MTFMQNSRRGSRILWPDKPMAVWMLGGEWGRQTVLLLLLWAGASRVRCCDAFPGHLCHNNCTCIACKSNCHHAAILQLLLWLWLWTAASSGLLYWSQRSQLQPDIDDSQLSSAQLSQRGSEAASHQVSESSSQPVRAAPAEWSMTEFVFDWKQLVAPSLGLAFLMGADVIACLGCLSILYGQPVALFPLFLYSALFGSTLCENYCHTRTRAAAHKENLLPGSFCVGDKFIFIVAAWRV